MPLISVSTIFRILEKKDAKAFTVFVLSITNVLGSKNVYGYNFSMDGARSSAIVPL